MNNKQKLAAASTSLLAAGMAHGSIVYSGPINTDLSGSSAYMVDLDGDFTIDYTVRFDGASGNNQLKPFVDARSSGNANAWILSKANGGAPLTLFGTNIDSNYATTFPTNKVGYLYEQYNNNTVVGDWPSTADTEGYVGVALTDGVTTTNYGWIHLIYKASDPNTKTLEVVDYAYETDNNTPIIAGAIATPGAPLIYKNPPSQTVGAGSSAQMQVVALADPAPTYQWQAGAVGSGVYTNLNDNGHFSGTATPTLNIGTAVPADAGDYIVIVSNNLGSVTNSPPATLTVQTAVLSGPTPTQEQLFAGQTARFNIQVVSGNSPTFQWRKDGATLSDNVNTSGSTSSNLVISSLAAGNSGNYDVVVGTTYGAVTSSIAPLTVIPTSGEAFESSMLALSPVSYYRLNETTDPSSGTAVAWDNTGGNNGIYGTAVQNGSSGTAGPRPDSGFPGFGSANYSVVTIANTPNSDVKVAPWNLNTNTVTMTAWIYPQGPQVGGAGVVYTRSTNNMVCGMAYYDTFGGTNWTLGYNWNDQSFAYFWRSGLNVPQNEWSLVAVVISPTNAIMYSFHDNQMDTATNTATHAVQSFNDVIYIGDDPQGSPGSHNFNGNIDEVAAFNRSLSSTDLQSIYFAAAGIAGFPPRLTLQPVSAEVFTNGTAHFVTAADGSQPLTYLWKGGASGSGVFTNLTSAANSPILAIQNVAAGNAGDYVLVVTNAGGAVTSSVVSLSLVPRSGEYYESTVLGLGGLAAYYKLDETANPANGGVLAWDYFGGYTGVYGTNVLNGFDGVAGPRPADGFLGFSSTNSAILLSETNDSAITLPPLNLNTNALTITAWINPTNPPQQFDGIVFCRGSGTMVAGLDFTQTNSAGQVCLGYHWNDAPDTYGWVSGLVPPTNQWSFVALVIDPVTTNATIWLMNTNGTSSASNFTTNNLAVQAFDAPTLIGEDSRLGSSLVFSGSIDNVAIFASALTAAQIQQLYTGATGTSTTLTVTHNGSNVQLSWPFGTLLESTSLTGPWTTNSAMSPYQFAPASPQKFYRVIIR
ncbi:MAG TPA: LamG-like jellyroll fold domain-containing protein [Verrucomicrobiae bacterium]|jgi:hypothetical protein|nr:LamG-like jellyroll fold domain-containing protein [Verrucomicrobiae bacterium]